MDRIAIDITFERLRAVNQVLATLDYQVFFDRCGKAQYAILHKVAVKLAKKQLDKFPGNGKPFKLTLEYYQAHELEQFLRFHLQADPQDYLVQIVADALNQKLA